MVTGALNGAGFDANVSFDDVYGDVLKNGANTLQQSNIPGAGGSQQQGNSGQSTACGSVSASRQLESLMIH